MKLSLPTYLRPPVYEDPEDAYVARLVHAICMIVFVAAAALLANNLLLDDRHGTLTSAVTAASAVAVFLLLQRRWLRAASAAIPTLFLLVVSLNVATSYGLHDVGLIGFPAVIVLAGLLLGERALFAFALLTTAALVVIYFLEVGGHVPRAFVEATDPSDIVNIATILLVTTAMLRLLVGNLSRSLRTSRRQARERERLIAELEAKNTELESFAYTVSHDLKTPLVTISNFVGALVPSAEKGDLDRLRQDVELINEAAARMKELMDDLLELSRIGFVIQPPREVAFAELAREALALVAGPVAQRGVEVRIAPDLPTVHADRERLVEVLQNLLENAVNFMGGQTEPRIEIGARPGNGGPVFFVRDNGIGIAPRYHDTVFELFHQLEPSGDGTGVGLALAKRVVEAHHGRIWIESAGPGAGTEVCFVLGDGG